MASLEDLYQYFNNLRMLQDSLVVTNVRYEDAIAAGIIPGARPLRITGYNDDVNNVEEHVWNVGGTYVFPTAEMQMEVVSSSANDIAGGSGVQVVEIHYLDSNYIEHETTVTLNGLNAVATSVSNIYRVNYFHAIQTGSGLKAAGNIDLRNLADTPIYARIATGDNHKQQLVYTVPLGKEFFIYSYGCGIGNAGGSRYGRFRWRITQDFDYMKTPKMYHTAHIVDIQDQFIEVTLDIPFRIRATASLVCVVISDNVAASAKTSAVISGVLKDL